MKPYTSFRRSRYCWQDLTLSRRPLVPDLVPRRRRPPPRFPLILPSFFHRPPRRHRFRLRSRRRRRRRRRGFYDTLGSVFASWVVKLLVVFSLVVGNVVIVVVGRF